MVLLSERQGKSPEGYTAGRCWVDQERLRCATDDYVHDHMGRLVGVAASGSGPAHRSAAELQADGASRPA